MPPLSAAQLSVLVAKASTLSADINALQADAPAPPAPAPAPAPAPTPAPAPAPTPTPAPAPAPAPASAPLVLYTDALSGPVAGGEGGLGGYLSVFGLNFGSTGLGTTTKVYVGGVEVANYRYLGASKVAGKLIGLQQITVQVGPLGGAALGVALPVVVKVNGVASTSFTAQMFTPCAGRVLFVALAGSDTTAVVNDITKPWRSLQNASASKGAYFAMQAGDHVVIRGGAWSDSNGVDTAWMKFGSGAGARNGTAAAWIHVTAYPGPIGGNAIEDVHYTCAAGKSGGIQGPWSAIAGTSGEYISVSNLRMEVAGDANRDAAPINFQYTAGPWRAVNNELGPWVAGNSSVLNAGGIAGHGKGNGVFGNHIHDIAGIASDLQNHGIYGDTTAENWEVAYNWIHDITGGSLVQFNDNQGGAGTYTLPHGGTWAGFVGMKVHHNWLENAAKYGINYNDQGSCKAGKYAGDHWSNVIRGTKLYPIRINSTQPDQLLNFTKNVVFDSMQASSGYAGYVENEGWGAWPASGFGPGGTIKNTFGANVLAADVNTSTSMTGWFADGYAIASTPQTYQWSGNTYYAGGHSIAALTQDATRTVIPGFMPAAMLTVPLNQA
jgi:hypothetical protein